MYQQEQNKIKQNWLKLFSQLSAFGKIYQIYCLFLAQLKETTCLKLMIKVNYLSLFWLRQKCLWIVSLLTFYPNKNHYYMVKIQKKVPFDFFALSPYIQDSCLYKDIIHSIFSSLSFLMPQIVQLQYHQIHYTFYQSNLPSVTVFKQQYAFDKSQKQLRIKIQILLGFFEYARSERRSFIFYFSFRNVSPIFNGLDQEKILRNGCTGLRTSCSMSLQNFFLSSNCFFLLMKSMDFFFPIKRTYEFSVKFQSTLFKQAFLRFFSRLQTLSLSFYSQQ